MTLQQKPDVDNLQDDRSRERHHRGGTWAGLLLLAACLAALILFNACQSAGPTPELMDARDSFARVSASQVRELAPDRLVVAAKALDAAESAHEKDPGSAAELHHAYLAKRRAQLAVLHAGLERAKRRTREAHEDRMRAEAALRRLAEQNRHSLLHLKQKLDSKVDELQKSEIARLDANAAEQEALRSLQEVAKVKQKEGKVVVALSGGVLFKSGHADLLPTARTALDNVVDAIKESEKDPKVAVIGHTDSTGSEQRNLALSRERAEAVRRFLVSQGLEPEQVKAEGRGESEPVAPNTSPDGRALNRRVEIAFKRSEVTP